MAIPASKTAMRGQLRNVLGSLSPAHVDAQSKEVAERLFTLGEFSTSEAVCIYVSMPVCEVQTGPILQAALEAGKRVFIPKVTGKRSEDMVMFEVGSFSEIEALPKNRWGIPEPSLEKALASPDGTTLGIIQTVLVPGVAFDETCARLGHGKGYYDSFLSRVSAANGLVGRGPPVTVGLALSEQIVQAVPTEPHDWRLNFVVLPDRVISQSDRAPV